MDKGLITEAALTFGLLVPIVISMLGGPESYFWQFFAWMVGING